MLTLGCHLSVAKGFYAMGKTALKIGANTFQFFTRNPRGSAAKRIDVDDVNKLTALMKENDFGKILGHAPYTLNPCSPDEDKRTFAIETMADDMLRMEYFPGNFYNFHPGSHRGQDIKVAIKQIIDALNSILTPEQTTTVLLETMAGKGSEVGRRFEELRLIIEGVELKDKLGVCMDTCHVYDAGYDIVDDLDGVLKEFDDIIGLKRLMAVHLNDSKNPFNSRKDRHETIGKGTIGLDAIIRIVSHEKLSHLPFYMETPNDDNGHKKEIELIRSELGV